MNNNIFLTKRWISVEIHLYIYKIMVKALDALTIATITAMIPSIREPKNIAYITKRLTHSTMVADLLLILIL